MPSLEGVGMLKVRSRYVDHGGAFYGLGSFANGGVEYW